MRPREKGVRSAAQLHIPLTMSWSQAHCRCGELASGRAQQQVPAAMRSIAERGARSDGVGVLVQQLAQVWVRLRHLTCDGWWQPYYNAYLPPAGFNNESVVVSYPIKQDPTEVCGSGGVGGAGPGGGQKVLFRIYIQSFWAVVYYAQD